MSMHVEAENIENSNSEAQEFEEIILEYEEELIVDSVTDSAIEFATPEAT